MLDTRKRMMRAEGAETDLSSPYTRTGAVNTHAECNTFQKMATVTSLLATFAMESSSVVPESTNVKIAVAAACASYNKCCGPSSSPLNETRNGSPYSPSILLSLCRAI
jgi:hypothetical protein